MNIVILGAGAWGTALAVALADRHQVMLWGRDRNAMVAMQTSRRNTTYLPEIALPDSVIVGSDFDATILHCNAAESLLIVATPVAGLRPLLQQLASVSIPNLIWLCKGFEEQSGLLPHQIVHEVMGAALPCGALSGPSFAIEVAQGLPTALTMASESVALRERVVRALHGPRLRIYATDDVVGVEVGGAVKNILAIATGLIDGLAFGTNARAALITRGLAEITRLGIALGGRADTFMGLAGVGDLMLTCTGALSRNRRVGLGLAEGKPLDRIVHELGHVAEGVRCAQAVRQVAAQLHVDMPIANAVASVLFDGAEPQQAIARLLAREARIESI